VAGRAAKSAASSSRAPRGAGSRASADPRSAAIFSRFATAKLNLGCGFDSRPGYINVDLQEFHKPDIVADILDLHEFPSVAFEEILAQDVLEHFHWRDTPRALYEWNRLLVMGGKLFLRTTYLNGLLRKFESPHYQSIPQQKLLIINLFSMQNYEGDYHLTAFTERLMRFYLWETGFEIAAIDIQDEWLFRIQAVKAVDYSFQDLVSGPASDAEFVRALYERVLRREPEPEGLASHLSKLTSGSTTREKMVRSFLLSDENQKTMAESCPDLPLQFHEASVADAGR
jgi:predicted SAM-dependent methyltransferase